MDTSKFLGGNGTPGAPYLIHNEAALLEARQNDSPGAEFLLVDDITLNQGYPAGFGEKVILKGAGHSITLKGGDEYVFSSSSDFYNIKFIIDAGTSNVEWASNSYYGDIFDCEFYCLSADAVTMLSRGRYHRCFAHGVTTSLDNNTQADAYDSYYLENECSYVSTKGTEVSQANKLLASSYPDLDPTGDNWRIVDGELPSLKLLAYGGLPITRVAGVTKLDGVGASRQIKAYTSSGAFISKTISDPSTGEFDLQTSPWKNGVTIVVDDDMGVEINASTTYALGDIVHPANFQGIAYVCTTAGDTDATLPTTYPEDGDFTNGTATFSAKPIHKPQVFSPVKPEIVLE